MADLRYVVDIDTRNARRNLSAIQTDITGLTASLTGLAGVFGVAFTASQIVDTAAKFENLRTTLGILYKDAALGAAAFENIKDLATQTSFSVEDLTTAYTKLLTAGIQPSNERLKLFSDVSSVAADSVGALQAITDLFARTTAGGLGLEDLNRLADRGIPVYQILARTLGLSRLEVAKFGQSADGAQKILAVLERELGRTFGGASAARANTLSQAMSNLRDSVSNLIDRMGQAGPSNNLTQAIQGLTEAINNINTQAINNIFDIIKAFAALAAGILIVTRVLPALNGGFNRLFTSMAGGAGAMGALSRSFQLIGNGALALKGLERAAANALIGLGGLLGFTNTFNKNLGTVTSNLLGVAAAIARTAVRFTALTAVIYGVVEGATALERAFFGTNYIETAIRGIAIALEEVSIAFGKLLNYPTDFIAMLLKLAGVKLDTVFGLGDAFIGLGERAKDARLLDEYTKQANAELAAMADHNKVIAAHKLKSVNITKDDLNLQRSLQREIAGNANKALVAYNQRIQAIKDDYGTRLDAIALDREALDLTDQQAAGLRARVDEENRLYEAIRRVKDQIATTEVDIKFMAPDQVKELAQAQYQLALLKNEQLVLSDLLNKQPAQIEQAVLALERAKFLKERDREATQQILEDTEEYGRLLSEQLGLQIEAQNRAIAITNDLVKENQLKERQVELEQAIRNMRGEDQAVIKEIYDLELRRRRLLEDIASIPDITAEARLQQEQRVNAEIDRSRAYIEQRAAQSRQEQDSYVTGWNTAFEQWRNNLQTAAEQGATIFSTLTRGFEDAMVNFVQTGKLSFKNLFNSLIAEATRAAANKLLMSIFGLAGGGGSGGGGGGFLGSIFGSLFGGFFANGGTLGANKFGIAGERGPELITGPATVTPLDRLAGTGATTVTYNIQAVDASSFRSLVARDPEFIFQVTEQGRRSLPIRSRR